MKSRLTHEDSVPTTEDRCAHILAMIEDIEKIVATRESCSPDNNWIWPIALERMFEIIGVAASHIPDEVKRSDSNVDWEMIANLDHRLADPLVRIEEDVLLNAALRLDPLKSFASRILA